MVEYYISNSLIKHLHLKVKSKHHYSAANKLQFYFGYWYLSSLCYPYLHTYGDVSLYCRSEDQINYLTGKAWAND